MLFSFVWVIFWPYLFILTGFFSREKEKQHETGWVGGCGGSGKSWGMWRGYGKSWGGGKMIKIYWKKLKRKKKARVLKIKPWLWKNWGQPHWIPSSHLAPVSCLLLPYPRKGWKEKETRESNTTMQGKPERRLRELSVESVVLQSKSSP